MFPIGMNHERDIIILNTYGIGVGYTNKVQTQNTEETQKKERSEDNTKSNMATGTGTWDWGLDLRFLFTKALHAQ